MDKIRMTTDEVKALLSWRNNHKGLEGRREEKIQNV